MRNKLAINHSKMLAYAGVLATPGRSPDVVCNLVSHCFDLPDVTIDSWQLRKVAIEPSQQNQLGSRNPKTRTAGYVVGRSVLGINFTLGARVPDRSGKFLLRIGNLPMERYLSFLPDGEHHQALQMFISFCCATSLRGIYSCAWLRSRRRECSWETNPVPVWAALVSSVSQRHRLTSHSTSGSNFMEQSVVTEQQRGNASLTLQVMNGNELESGRAARCLFPAMVARLVMQKAATGLCRTPRDLLRNTLAPLSDMMAHSVYVA
jgi:hypothetical protein